MELDYLFFRSILYKQTLSEYGFLRLNENTNLDITELNPEPYV